MAEGHENIKRLYEIIKIFPFGVYERLGIGLFIIHTVCLICNSTENVVEFLLARLIIDFFWYCLEKTIFFFCFSFSLNRKKKLKREKEII